MSRMRRKIRRLRDMTLRELLHRAGTRLSRRADHARMRLRRAGRSERRFVKRLAADDGVKRYLQETAAPRFYLPVTRDQRRRLAEAVSQRFPFQVANAIEEADRLCDNRVPLLGFGEVDLGADVDWHRDPVSGARWPRRFSDSYDLIATDNVADPKVVHELNRHQHLPRLAKAFFLTGEERYAEHALAQIESWIEQNPENLGINWSESLEIGIRSLSWLWTLFLLLPSTALDEARAQRIVGSLLAQLHHVGRYLSLYSSPNTHLIGEAAALFIGGQVFADLKQAGAWQERGRELLVEQVERQDVGGVHAELSSYYHCYAVDFFLQVAILAQRNGSKLPTRFWQRLEDQIDFVAHLTRADGTLPMLGDDDGGRALALAATDYRSFADGLSTGAVLFERPDWKHASGGLHEETLWLLGAGARQAYWDIASEDPPQRLYDYRVDAGYFVQRTGWGGRDAHLTFDCGGLGHLGGGHGHADALSVTAYAPEGDILVDPGTYVYNLQPRWRDHFRSSAAHNTVLLDGQSQSLPEGPFRWKTGSAARLTGLHSTPWMEFLEGQHDGFPLLAEEARHRRRILYVPNEYWLIVDDLSPSEAPEHEVEILYQFAARCHPLRLTRQEGRVAVHVDSDVESSAFGMTVAGCVPLEAEVLHGEVDPPRGWASHRYGERHPAPLLRLTCRTALPATFVTVLAPFGSRLGARRHDLDAASEATPPAVRLRHAEPGGGVVVTVESELYTDWIVASPGTHRIRLPDAEVRGEIFWMRTRGDQLDNVFAREASLLRHGGRTLLSSEVPVPYTALEQPTRLEEPVHAVAATPPAAPSFFARKPLA